MSQTSSSTMFWEGGRIGHMARYLPILHRFLMPLKLRVMSCNDLYILSASKSLTSIVAVITTVFTTFLGLLILLLFLVWHDNGVEISDLSETIISVL